MEFVSSREMSASYIVRSAMDALIPHVRGEVKFTYQIYRVNTYGTRSRAWGILNCGRKILYLAQ